MTFCFSALFSLDFSPSLGKASPPPDCEGAEADCGNVDNKFNDKNSRFSEASRYRLVPAFV